MADRFRLSAAALLFWATCAAASEPVTIFGTQSGQVAYDGDEFGGNPFASAVISVLRDPPLDDLAFEIEVRTGDFSYGHQIADASALLPSQKLQPAAMEKPVALVIVFADYGSRDGLVSLPGAAFDAWRVSKALADAGYTVETVIAADREEYLAGLAWIERESAAVDRALIYTTGHGIENDGAALLVPPDVDGTAQDEADALVIPVSTIGASLKARKANMVLYAACRERVRVDELAAKGERTLLR